MLGPHSCSRCCITTDGHSLLPEIRSKSPVLSARTSAISSGFPLDVIQFVAQGSEALDPMPFSDPRSWTCQFTTETQEKTCLHRRNTRHITWLLEMFPGCPPCARVTRTLLRIKVSTACRDGDNSLCVLVSYQEEPKVPRWQPWLIGQ